MPPFLSYLTRGKAAPGELELATYVRQMLVRAGIGVLSGPFSITVFPNMVGERVNKGGIPNSLAYVALSLFSLPSRLRLLAALRLP